MAAIPGEVLNANSTNRVINSWHFANQKAAQARIKNVQSNKDQQHLIDTDFYNLRTSINWLAEQNDRGFAELLLGYLDTLFPFLQQKRHFIELDKWCTAGLHACDILQRNPTVVLLMKSETQFSLGRWKEARANVAQAFVQINGLDPTIHAQTLFLLGRLQIELGEYKAALVTLKQAEDLYKQIGNTGKIMEIRSEVGAYYLNRRDLDSALEEFLAVDELHRTTGDMQSFDHTQMMLGVVYRKKHEYEKAIRYLTAFYERGKAQPGQPMTATAAHHIAWVYLEQGNLVEARRMCGEAIARYQEQNDARGLSDAYEQLAAILIEEGHLDEAKGYLVRCIDMRNQIGNQPGLVSSLRRLALVRLLTRDYWQAIGLVWMILVNYRRMNMLSRQRIARLGQDAIVGMGRAIFNRNKPQAYDRKSGVSVMESFFRALVGR